MTLATDPLPFRDTPQLYGRVTRLLHWSIAALLLWQFAGILTGLEFISGTHHATGTVLFVLIVLRIVWAVVNRGNRPAHQDGALGMAARAGHFMLYAAMFVVPAVAILRAWGSTRGFAPFGFTIFPPQETAVEWTRTLAGALHGEVAWLLAVMILGHVVMVGLHQGMWRDGTLARMAGRAR